MNYSSAIRAISKSVRKTPQQRTIYLIKYLLLITGICCELRYTPVCLLYACNHNGVQRPNILLAFVVACISKSALDKHTLGNGLLQQHRRLHIAVPRLSVPKRHSSCFCTLSGVILQPVMACRILSFPKFLRHSLLRLVKYSPFIYSYYAICFLPTALHIRIISIVRLPRSLLLYIYSISILSLILSLRSLSIIGNFALLHNC